MKTASRAFASLLLPFEHTSLRGQYTLKLYFVTGCAGGACQDELTGCAGGVCQDELDELADCAGGVCPDELAGDDGSLGGAGGGGTPGGAGRPGGATTCGDVQESL